MDSDFPGDTSDSELVQRIRANDPHAFTQLFHKYNADICKHLTHIVRNSEDAKDLTQRTFENIYKGLPTLENGASLRSWIYQIANNIAKDDLRAKQRRPWSDGKEFDVDREDFDAAFEKGRNAGHDPVRQFINRRQQSTRCTSILMLALFGYAG